MQEFSFGVSDYLRGFTLITGDVNSGKTTFTKRILCALIREGIKKITLIDLAPQIEEADVAGRGHLAGVGGGIEVPAGERFPVKRFTGVIAPPRLRGKSEEAALLLAGRNAEVIREIFLTALRDVTEVLFINDCSMYLHAGDPEDLIRWIRSAPAAVVNGYYGARLGMGRISARERQGMDYLIKRCDRLIPI